MPGSGSFINLLCSMSIFYNWKELSYFTFGKLIGSFTFNIFPLIKVHDLLLNIRFVNEVDGFHDGIILP